MSAPNKIHEGVRGGVVLREGRWRMTWFSVVLGIACALGVAGYLMRRKGDMAGLLGRTDAVHGRVERARRLDEAAQGAAPSFRQAFPRLLAICAAVGAVLVLLSLCGVIDRSFSLAAIADMVAVVAVGSMLTYQEGGSWRSIGYALAGCMLGSALSFVAGIVIMASAPDAAPAVNLLTMACATVGVAAACAYMAPRYVYVREFTDGTISTVEVAGNSAAARAMDVLADPQWRPAKAEVAAAEDVRNFRGRMNRAGRYGKGK